MSAFVFVSISVMLGKHYGSPKLGNNADASADMLLPQPWNTLGLYANDLGSHRRMARSSAPSVIAGMTQFL
jgi:hypothetical protein